jgi:tetratricopeptide (TPR) repeat protein
MVAAVAVLCFIQTAGYGFVFDDQQQIVENPRIRSFANLDKTFTENVWAFRGAQNFSNYFRPMQISTYTATFWAGGLSPFAFHLTNILLNLLVCLAVLWVMMELFSNSTVAVGGALLFAAHPMHTEAVAWIAGVPELGSGLCYFLCIGAYLRCRKTERYALVWLAVSCLTFFCSLLYKEMALTIPMIIGIIDVYMLPRETSGPASANWRARIQRWLPFGIALAFYLILRIRALGVFSQAHRQLHMSLEDKLGTMAYLLARYVQKLLIPLRQNAFYLFEPVSRMKPAEWLLPILFLVLCGLLLWRYANKDRTLMFVVAWILITLLPVLALENVGANVFAERYLYIPSLGFCFLISTLLYRYLAPRKAAAALIVLVVLYGVATVLRNPVWRDDKTLYLNTVSASPDAANICINLATMYGAEGNLREARRYFERALEAHPRTFVQEPDLVVNAYFGLSYIAELEGNLQGALKYGREGLKLQPRRIEPYEAFGRLLLKAGDLSGAENCYRSALQFDPNHANVRTALGDVLALKGDWEGAERELRAALKIAPRSVAARVGMGLVYQGRKRWAEALAVLNEALALDSRNVAAKNLLQEIQTQMSAGKLP